MNLKLPITSFRFKSFAATLKLALFVVLFGTLSGQAQVASYSLDQAPLAIGAGVDPILNTPTILVNSSVAPNDDAVFPVVFGGAPAMNFKFNGTSYPNVYISTNGFVYFDDDNNPTSTAVATVIAPIGATTSTGYDGAISVFGANLIYPTVGTTTSIKYALEGTAPNRKFVVEWTARKRTTPGNGEGGITTFQLQLFEDGHATESNTIVMQYDLRGTGPTYTGSQNINIGLRGPNRTVAEVISLSYTATTAWPAAWTPTNSSSSYVVSRTNSAILDATARQLTWRPGTCFVPTDLEANSITGSGATFDWSVPSPTPAAYDFEVRTSGAPGSGGGGLVASGSPTTNTGTVNTLSPNTTYTVYVRSSCGGGIFSAWSAGVIFTTQCASVALPYAQYFDPLEAPGFSVPNLPNCTNAVKAGAGNIWVTENANFAADFFDEHLVYNSSPSAPADSWYFTRGLQMTAGVTYRVSYIYGGTAGPGIVNQMNVAFGLYAEPSAMVNVIHNDTNIKISPLDYVTNFIAPTTGVYYLGFHAKSALNNGQLFVDNIDVMVEDCKPPTAITIPAGTITPSSATVFFTPPSPSPGDGYQYYLSIDPTPPIYSTAPTGVVAAGATSLVLSPLPQLTTYYIWIRSNCGTKYSLWSPIATFTTTGVPLPTPISMTANLYTGTGCNRTFFDSGGPGGNYGNNENKTYTFTAPPGFQLQVVFNSFQTENNWDGLMIYDGPNTGSPIIPSGLPGGGFGVTAPPNSYYGTSSPGTFYSTNNAITFKFTTDGSITSGGWSASLRCVQAPTVTSFSPTNNGCPATLVTVTVNGTNFGPGAVVSFNGVPAVTTYDSNVKLTAVLPAGATTGVITVTSGSPAASGSSTGIFTVNKPSPVTTGISVCAETPATGLLTTSTVCAGFVPALPRNSIAANFSGPSLFANRQPFITNSTTCQFSTVSRPYTSIEFQVSATGVYTFLANSGIDSMGYITQAPFNTPGSCMAGFVIGDDDSGPGFDALITVNLTAGITYTLYTTTYFSNSPPNFTWTVTPPSGQDILVDGAAVMQWFTMPVSGTFPTDATLVHTGDSYNPVGDPGSGLADMNTPGIYKFYAACSTNLVCPTETIYEIKALPTVAMSGAGSSICSGAVVPITATGTSTSYVWSSSVAGTLFTDAAGTVPYVSGSNLATVYVKTTATVTITLVGSDSASSCSKTITGVYTVSTKTWNGSAWAPVGAPTITDGIVFNGNYAALTDLTGCSCTVNAGAQVTIKSGYTLKLENGLTVAAAPASLTFENNASLVQVNDLAVNVGPITYIRNTTPMALYDYTYWSSPVSPQTLFGLSQYTLSDKFYLYNPLMDNYQNVASSTLMDKARGYLVRAPQPGVGPMPWTAGTSFTGQFKGSTGDNGVPNNGVVPVDLFNTGAGIGTNDRLNLIGNPYPSAVNIDLFLDSSVSGVNAGKLDGIVYLWTHNTPIAGNSYIYSDYAIYTYLGGIGTQQGGGTGNTNVPDGEIAAGQAFYVKAHPSTPIVTGAESVTAIFNNSMRVSGNNDQFFRLSAQDKNRVWLEFKNDLGAYKQTLVGYTTGATNEFDSQFDGEILEAGNSVSLYSIGSPEKYAIQGRAMPFDQDDLVPIGYRTANAGNFEIALSNFDGLFTNQDIYLEDKVLNVIHNLKNGSYTFATAVGTFEERFVLRYTDTTLGIDNSIHNENAALVYKVNDALHVVSGNAIMEQVKVYDVRGRLLATKQKVGSSSVVFDNLAIAQEVLMVQITLQDGTVISKKTVF